MTWFLQYSVRPETILTILAVAISVDQLVTIVATTGAVVLSLCFWLHTIGLSSDFFPTLGQHARLQPDSFSQEHLSQRQLEEEDLQLKAVGEEMKSREELSSTPVGGSSVSSPDSRSQSESEALVEQAVEQGYLGKVPAEYNLSEDDVKGPLEVPIWFLNYNLKTTSELANHMPKVIIKEDAPDTAYGEDAVFEIKSAVYNNLWSVLSNPSQTWESANEENLPFFRRTTLLLTAINTMYGARGHRAFFEAVVEQFATDIGADLIALDIEDVLDLGEYWLNGLESQGCVREGKRDKPLLFAHTLLDVPDQRIFRHGTGSATPERRPLIIHIPDVHHFDIPDDNDLQGNPRWFDFADIKEILDVIQLAIINQAGGSGATLLVLSSRYYTTSHRNTDIPLVHALLEAEEDITLVPLKTPSQVKLLEEGPPNCDRHLRINIRSFQRQIRATIGDFTSPLLQPHTAWEFINDCETSRRFCLGHRQHGEIISVGKKVALQVGRHGSVTADHIQQSLIAVASHGEMLKDWDIESSVDDVQSRWAQFSPHIRKKLEQAENGNNDAEKQLLDLVVDPGSIMHGWSNIQLDLDTKDAIAQLIYQATGTISSHLRSGILANVKVGGALLYGPPGTGKTHLARVLAHEHELVMISVSSADIESSRVGETEKTIQNLFSLARKLHPSIIFIDEADSLLKRREPHDHTWERARLNQFLAEMDGLKQDMNSPFVILATNLPQALDDAVLRRVPARLFMGLPRARARREILAICLREDVVADDVNVDDLVRRTKGYTGSDLHTLCVQAALISAAESQASRSVNNMTGLSSIQRVHFEKALRRSAPTSTGHALAAIREFAKASDPQALAQFTAPDNDEVEQASTSAEPSLPRQKMGITTGTLTPPDQSIDNVGDSGSVTGGEAASEFASPEFGVPEAPTSHKAASALGPLYTPLKSNSRQIRVLSITPQSLKTEDSWIECRLETVDLDDMEVWYHELRTILQANDGEFPFDVTKTPPAWILATAANELAKEQPKDTEMHWAYVLEKFNSIPELKTLKSDVPFERLTRWTEFAPRYEWGDYIAMSYTWGPPEPSHTILVNNHEVQVGGNLYQMLLRLRKSVEVKQSHLKVWIDALCINQNDDKEKETEVQKMDVIYNMALAVRGWIGAPSSATPGSPFDTAYTLVRQWFSQHQGIPKSYISDPTLYPQSLLRSLRTVAFELIRLPYWSRTWITQEIALANSVCFWYGDDYLFVPGEIKRALEPFVDFSSALNQPSDLHFMWDDGELDSSSDLPSIQEQRMLSQHVHRIFVKFDLRELPRVNNTGLLITILTLAQASAATDLRDKVYGTLALLPLSIRDSVKPSYAEFYAALDAYADFAKACILGLGDLSIWTYLTRLQPRPGGSSLPSWAIDLSSEADDALVQERTTPPSRPGSRFNANAGKQQCPAFSHDGRIMYCEGLIIDSIDTLTMSPSRAREITLQDSYFNPLSSVTNPPAAPSNMPNEDARTALARVLHAEPEYDISNPSCLLNLAWGLKEDRPPDGLNWQRLEANIKDASELAHAHMSLLWWRALLHANLDFMIKGCPLHSYFSSGAAQEFQPHEYTYQDLSQTSYRRLCMTSNGRVGTVPGLAQAGDKIVVLFACQKPVVVRPKGKHYEFIGTCFVDGLMKGEAVADMESGGKLNPEMISFC
ncbi:uncharacterized protein QC763_503950 [Podospora pseudopauciseta]|uniref:AAA+ ATPase domain-containing protein n=1 Tax=Podospora pseudopauciseta TaxID=2093780 RepID=A0ABR0H894_9PEZI|nr:hypothetical protein QC763_503950 [Podospora pseudopauciseta]